MTSLLRDLSRFGDHRDLVTESINIFGQDSAASTVANVLADSSTLTVGTFLTAADTIRIKAGGNANDDAAGTGAQSILITSALDQNLDLIKSPIEIATAGASASSATNEKLVRVFAAEVGDVGTYANGNGVLATAQGTNADDITIETSGGTEVAKILQGKGATAASIFTVPRNHTFFLAGLSYAAGGAQTASFQLWERKSANIVSGSGMRGKCLRYEFDSVKNDGYRAFETFLRFEEYSDIWGTGYYASSSGVAGMGFVGLLVRNPS